MVNQLGYIHITEHSSARNKRKKALTHAATWMHLETIMLREESGSQKVPYRMTSSTQESQSANFVAMEHSLAVARGHGAGQGGRGL